MFFWWKSLIQGPGSLPHYCLVCFLTLSCATSEGIRAIGLSCPFLNIKSALILQKKKVSLYPALKNSRSVSCSASLFYVVHEMLMKVPLLQQTFPGLKNSWFHAWTLSSLCLNINSNDFAPASDDGIINVTSVLNNSSFITLGGTEQFVASLSTTHLTSLGYSWLELYDRLMI